MQRQRIDVVIGTRPEAIKLGPVVQALAAQGLAPRLLLTGQHRLEMRDHGLDGFERVQLGCPGEPDPHRHVQSVGRAVAPLLANRPAMLVVQGDTSSAYGAALAGFAAQIPVAHVEAGLRSFDPAMPWPEEDYRTAIDARSDLLFAPTPGNAANLRAEAAPGEIHVTGNSGIDSLLAVLDGLQPPVPRRDQAPKLLVTCHRRENWETGLPSLSSALIGLVSDYPVTVDFVLHPNAAVKATMRDLLGGCAGIRLIEPLPHRAMISAMRNADMLLSDSGGVQEEAPVLGVPLLVLRDKTERPEGIASGNMVLVGTDAGRVRAAVIRLLDRDVRAAMSRRSFPFGDGRSAPRIARHIAEFLGRSAAQQRKSQSA